MKDKTAKKPNRRKPHATAKVPAKPGNSQETRYFFLGHKVMDEIKILARLAAPNGQAGKS